MSLFTIIDYKTGMTIARRKDIEQGMSLQLPVYLYAVEKILSEKIESEMKGVAGIYYSLTPPVKEQIGLASEEHSGKAFLASRSRTLVQTDDELKVNHRPCDSVCKPGKSLREYFAGRISRRAEDAGDSVLLLRLPDNVPDPDEKVPSESLRPVVTPDKSHI